jgi:hypothetical protein
MLIRLPEKELQELANARRDKAENAEKQCQKQIGMGPRDGTSGAVDCNLLSLSSLIRRRN